MAAKRHAWVKIFKRAVASILLMALCGAAVHAEESWLAEIRTVVDRINDFKDIAKIPNPMPVDTGRIHIPKDDPLQPYVQVDKCPKGQVPVVVDWPRPGDKTCRDANDPPKIYMNEQPWSDMTKTVEECPEGTQPVIVNFPNPGDKTCRAKDDPPKIIVPKNDALEPYETLESCPSGQTSVITHVPQYGDMTCRSVTDPVRINIPTNDPFQPYIPVDKCPGGKTRFVVNWPKPGDMSCR